MTATKGTYVQGLSEAQIAEERLTPEQRGLLQAVFAFRQCRGDDYYSNRLLSHFLLHCDARLKVAQIARPGWTLEDFKRAVAQAKHGKIAVLQFHGVPDTAHNWVTTSKEQFEGYLKYLADNKFQVIALRDLSRYVDEQIVPTNPWGVIEDRQRQLATNCPAQEIPEEARRHMVNALSGAFQIFRDKVMEELKVSQDQKKKLL